MPPASWRAFPAASKDGPDSARQRAQPDALQPRRQLRRSSCSPAASRRAIDAGCPGCQSRRAQVLHRRSREQNGERGARFHAGQHRSSAAPWSAATRAAWWQAPTASASTSRSTGVGVLRHGCGESRPRSTGSPSPSTMAGATIRRASPSVLTAGRLRCRTAMLGGSVSVFSIVRRHADVRGSRSRAAGGPCAARRGFRARRHRGLCRSRRPDGRARQPARFRSGERRRCSTATSSETCRPRSLSIPTATWFSSATRNGNSVSIYNRATRTVGLPITGRHLPHRHRLLSRWRARVRGEPRRAATSLCWTASTAPWSRARRSAWRQGRSPSR